MIGPTKKWAFAHWCASTILALRHNSFRYQLYAAYMENTNQDALRQGQKSASNSLGGFLQSLRKPSISDVARACFL